MQQAEGSSSVSTLLAEWLFRAADGSGSKLSWHGSVRCTTEENGKVASQGIVGQGRRGSCRAGPLATGVASHRGC